MRPRPIVCGLLIAGLMLGLNTGALAQDYPTRQVKIIIEVFGLSRKDRPICE